MSNTHEVNVIRVGEILPHPNADKLEITMVGGYQVVIGKGNFKAGDLAVYVQPDSVVPQTEPFKFIWQDHVGIDGVVPAKRRRITVKRLRKEYSEGLLMPVGDFAIDFIKENDVIIGAGIPTFKGVYVHDLNAVTGYEATTVSEGDDVAAMLEIEHYVPEFDVESSSAETAARPKRKYPRSLKGWFYFLLRKIGLRNAGGRSYAQEVSFDFPVYDVNALKNAKRGKFIDGELVQITEKIHGSNGRFAFVDDKFYVGSHEQWKMDGANVWWNVARQFPEIEAFCRQYPGLVLYGEVGPTQKGFRYGADEGKTFFFAFDVYDPTKGEWYWPSNLSASVNTAPVLYAGPYSLDVVKQFVDGPSTVPGAKNIREGIVISSATRRLKLKVVSNAYLEGDSK